MPAAGPAQVAAVEFVRAALLSAVALLPPAGPALPRIPGRALRRFSVAFAEWAVVFPAAVADPAEVDARRCDCFFDSSEMRETSREIPMIAAMMMKMMF